MSESVQLYLNRSRSYFAFTHQELDSNGICFDSTNKSIPDDYAEVQQWLVDRTSGEGGLRGGLHPQPGQTGEHPSAAGAEDEAEPTQLQVTIKKKTISLRLQNQRYKRQPHF